MTDLMKRDNNELRYNAILLLERNGNPDYYKQLLRNAKMFFLGLGRKDLVLELDKLIHNNIELKLGADINHVLFVHKNLPFLNSFTRSKLSQDRRDYIYKYTIDRWLDEIEEWIIEKAISLEDQIIFTTPPKQWI